MKVAFAKALPSPVAQSFAAKQHDHHCKTKTCHYQPRPARHRDDVVAHVAVRQRYARGTRLAIDQSARQQQQETRQHTPDLPQKPRMSLRL